MTQAPRVTVWTVALDAAPGLPWRRVAVLLDDTERARAARFAFERHRCAFVVAHALKRLMLSAIGGVAPQLWTFDTEPGGKPRVSSHAGPQFNLSHTDRFVACGVSDELELGVDVEAINCAAPLELARTYFASEERRWIDGRPASEQSLGFLRVWTLKEAFVKALGRGLAQPLQDFSFGFDPIRVTFHDPALGDTRAWRFEQREIGGHLLALAWRNGAQEACFTVREMRLETLLAEALIWS
jgi:4'-phosphopantetheinyl transferase